MSDLLSQFVSNAAGNPSPKPSPKPKRKPKPKATATIQGAALGESPAQEAQAIAQAVSQMTPAQAEAQSAAIARLSVAQSDAPTTTPNAPCSFCEARPGAQALPAVGSFAGGWACQPCASRIVAAQQRIAQQAAQAAQPAQQTTTAAPAQAAQDDDAIAKGDIVRLCRGRPTVKAGEGYEPGPNEGSIVPRGTIARVLFTGVGSYGPYARLLTAQGDSFLTKPKYLMRASKAQRAEYYADREQAREWNVLSSAQKQAAQAEPAQAEPAQLETFESRKGESPRGATQFHGDEQAQLKELEAAYRIFRLQPDAATFARLTAAMAARLR